MTYLRDLARANQQLQAKLDAFGADGIVDSNESLQTKRFLLDYRATVQQIREQAAAEATQTRDDYDVQIRAAEGKFFGRRQTHEVAQLKLAKYYAMRPYELIDELTETVLDRLAQAKSPTYEAAVAVCATFYDLYERFCEEIRSTPPVEAALDVTHIERELSKTLGTWRDTLLKVFESVDSTPDPQQRAYLKGMEQALGMALDDISRLVESNESVPWVHVDPRMTYDEEPVVKAS